MAIIERYIHTTLYYIVCNRKKFAVIMYSPYLLVYFVPVDLHSVVWPGKPHHLVPTPAPLNLLEELLLNCKTPFA